MAVTGSTIVFENGEKFQGKIESDQIVVRYRVDVSSAYQYIDQMVSDAISGGYLPSPGEVLRPGSDYTAKTLNAEESGDAGRLFYFVEVTFSNEAVEYNPLEPGSTSPPSRKNKNNPENDSPTWTVRSSIEQRAANFDYNGTAVINSAGDIVDPLPELFVTKVTVDYSFNTNNAILAYSNWVGTTNTDKVRITNSDTGEYLEILPYQGLITDYECVGPSFRYPDTGLPVMYYTHRFSFEVIAGNIPSQVTLLDPSLKLWDAVQNLYYFELLRRPDTTDPITYYTQGTMISNVGLNESIKLDWVWFIWTNRLDWLEGSLIVHNNNYYRATQPSGPNSGVGPVEPGVNPTVGSGQLSWKAFWQKIQVNTNTPGYPVGKKRILQGDITAVADIETALQPTDTPAYLDEYGRLLDDQSGLTTIYALTFFNGRQIGWGGLPFFTVVP